MESLLYILQWNLFAIPTVALWDLSFSLHCMYVGQVQSALASGCLETVAGGTRTITGPHWQGLPNLYWVVAMDVSGLCFRWRCSDQWAWQESRGFPCVWQLDILKHCCVTALELYCLRIPNSSDFTLDHNFRGTFYCRSADFFCWTSINATQSWLPFTTENLVRISGLSYGFIYIHVTLNMQSV